MGARIFPRKDGGGRWLNTDDLDVVELLLQCFSTACDCSSGTNACNEGVHRFTVHGGNDLRSGCLSVDLRISGVIKLLRHEVVRVFRHQLFRPLYGALHTELGSAQFSLCSKTLQDHPPLGTHVLRHYKDDVVAFHRTHERQTDPCITAGGLDDGRTGF